MSKQFRLCAWLKFLKVDQSELSYVRRTWSIYFAAITKNVTILTNLKQANRKAGQRRGADWEVDGDWGDCVIPN